MRVRFENILENKWYQEAGILAFAFTLFATKNDWIVFRSFHDILPAICYFLILYFHAQTNRFLLLPILFKDQRPLIYILFTVVLAFLFSVILYKFSTSWIYESSYLYRFSHQKSYQYQLASVVGTLICVLGPTTFLKFYSDQKKQANETLLLNQMQLNSLKNQLNPHFLFNTFNTLYGISLEFPERTPDLIMKVSQLMRYQVESNTKQCVSVEDEVSFISSYIQLEKERVGYRCEINYECKIDCENTYKISPMLLIAFVENAFKHGTCAIENCYVDIKLTVESGKLSLKVKNSIPEKQNTVVSTKIGIKNTTERLKLIYGDSYKLDISEDQKIFTVNLEMQLKKSTC